MIITIKVPEYPEWQDISHLLKPDSYIKDVLLCNQEYKSAIDTLSLTLNYDRLIAAFFLDIEHGEKIYIKTYRDDGEIDFTGYVTTAISLSKTDVVAPLQIKARDNTYRLDEQISTDIQYPSSLDSQGATVKTIFTSLCKLAGYTSEELYPQIHAPEVVRMISEDKEEYTYRELLDELLKQYGYVLYANPAGRLNLHKWLLDIEEPSKVLSDKFLISQNFSISKADEEYGAVEIEWTEPALLDTKRLYRDARAATSSGEAPGTKLLPGHYYPEDADIEEVYQEYRTDWLDRGVTEDKSRIKNKDITLITSDSHVISSFDVDPGLDIVTDFGPRRAKCTVSNPTDDMLYLYGFEIWGRALIREKIRRTTIGDSTTKKTIQAEYIYTAEAAATYAKAMYQHLKYGDITYSFSLKEELVQAGDIVRIIQTEPAIDTTVIILSQKTLLGVDGWTYTAMGLSGVGDLEVIHAEYLQELKDSEDKAPFRLEKRLHETDFVQGFWYTRDGDTLYALNLITGNITSRTETQTEIMATDTAHYLTSTPQGLLRLVDGSEIWLGDTLVATDGYSPTLYDSEVLFLRDGKVCSIEGLYPYQPPEIVHRIKGSRSLLCATGLTAVWLYREGSWIELVKATAGALDIHDPYVYWQSLDTVFRYDTVSTSILPIYTGVLDFAMTSSGDIYHQGAGNNLHHSSTDWVEDESQSAKLVTEAMKGKANALGRTLTGVPDEIMSTVKIGDIITGLGIPNNTRVLDYSGSSIAISSDLGNGTKSFSLEYKRKRQSPDFYKQDMYGRIIDIGSRGLRATDQSGEVIHDIIRESGEGKYLGHLYTATGWYDYNMVKGINSTDDIPAGVYVYEIRPSSEVVITTPGSGEPGHMLPLTRTVQIGPIPPITVDRDVRVVIRLLARLA